jgi:flagellar export protein FliJ
MANLNSLIRVRKYAVEQKQKFLSELYRQAEELQTQKKTMLEQLAEEEEKTRTMEIEMLVYFGPYAQAVKERVKDIDDSISLLNKRIDIAREDMRLAFAELKKVEITQENREAAEATKQQKKEDAVLEEIALQTHRKKLEE